MLHSRKLFAFLLTLMLLLSLAACTGGNNEQKPDDSNSSDVGNLPDNGGTPGGETDDSQDEADSDADDTDESDSGDKPADSTVDLTAFFDTLSETYELSSTADMDETLTASYLPGLSEISLRQSVLKTPTISAVVCEILLVECESIEDAAAVEEIFQTRMQTQIDGGAWYPASIETWEDAQIVTAGNYVALFAHADAEAMAEDFSAMFAE